MSWQANARKVKTFRTNTARIALSVKPVHPGMVFASIFPASSPPDGENRIGIGIGGGAYGLNPPARRNKFQKNTNINAANTIKNI